MASSKDFVEYVSEQLAQAGAIRYRQMFGEYGFYCDDKFFAVVCDNQLFVKITDGGKRVLEDPVTAPPYQGAKPYFLISDLEDRELLTSLIIATCSDLPEPKPKNLKNK